MKIIDQTPFFKENGSLSLMDRGKAMMKFGASWIQEVEAQKPVIAVLERVLDRKFTLLRNVNLPGLDTLIPFILVGPTGVYVMCVNPRPGVFSARGDQWGVISGGSARPEKPNLLTRTERMARVIQVYLQRQGYSDLFGVEAVLLCSDPTTNVDSVRPIIRVVMRDALERFGVSIAQGRVVLTPESVFTVTNRLLNKPTPAEAKPGEPAEISTKPGDSPLLDSALSGPDPSLSSQNLPTKPFWALQPVLSPPPLSSPQNQPPFHRKKGMTRNQVIYLILMVAVWLILLAILAFLIARDFGLPLFTL